MVSALPPKPQNPSRGGVGVRFSRSTSRLGNRLGGHAFTDTNKPRKILLRKLFITGEKFARLATQAIKVGGMRHGYASLQKFKVNLT